MNEAESTKQAGKDQPYFSREDENQKKSPFWMTRTMAEDFTRSDVLMTTVREGLIYAIFITAVVYSTDAKRHLSMFYLTEGLDMQFLEKDFTTTKGLTIKFNNIKSTADFWSYARTLLLDSLYWEYYYDPYEPIKPASEADKNVLFENKLLGTARLRQVKVKNNSCTIQKSFRKLIKKCYDVYEPNNEDFESFGKKTGTAWVYNSADETKSISYAGEYSVYNGGGFYQDLPNNKKDSLAIIQDLYDNLWITRGTRVVFVDFSLYNANVNLFCTCKLVFEFPPTGGIVPSYRFKAVFLESGLHSESLLIFSTEIIVYVLGVFYLFEEIREIMYFKLNYLTQFWTYMDVLILSLIVGNLFTSVILLPSIPDALRNIAEHQDKYGNLEYIAQIKETNTNICAIMLFFAVIKIFKYLNFNKTMGQINNTLKRCTWDLFCFIVMFMIIFCAYSILGHLLFGSQVKDFSTFGTAMFTLLRTILGDFDYQAIERADRVLAPFYFITFIFFVFFILLNMFLAIINDTYADVKTEIAIAPDEMNMTDFLKRAFFDLLRKCGIRFAKGIEKKETNVTIRQIREAFKKCGFSDLEIEMFFARFNIDPLANVVNYDAEKILKELEQSTASTKTEENVYVQLNDFLAQQERLDRIEHSINILSKKLEALVGKLNELENARKNKVAKG